MPHVTKETIDKFIEDLSKPRAFPEQTPTLEKYNMGYDTDYELNSHKGIYVPQTGRDFR